MSSLRGRVEQDRVYTAALPTQKHKLWEEPELVSKKEGFHSSFNSYWNPLSWNKNTTFTYLWHPNSSSYFVKDLLLLISGIPKVKGGVFWTGYISYNTVALEAARGAWRPGHRWGGTAWSHPLRQPHHILQTRGQASSLCFTFSSERSLAICMDECVLCVYSFFSFIKPRFC